MSGHSKWATTKREKGGAPAPPPPPHHRPPPPRSGWGAAGRGGGGAAGTREGGSGDPRANMTLATAIDKARAASVPNDNIERAIKRGTGELEGGARHEEVAYEGYGPGGVALFIQALTDNRNRTAQEIRHAFTRNNGNLGETGTTAWM